jgi:CxxC motif-containing protein
MDETEVTCVICPVGCKVLVRHAEGNIVSLSGSECPRGDEYAAKECLSPERILTATVAAEGGELPRLPVKTDRHIPKDRLLECALTLARVRVKAPVALGDVVAADILGTGANVVATRPVARAHAERLS